MTPKIKGQIEDVRKSSILSVQLFFLEEISRIEMFLKLLVLLNGEKEEKKAISVFIHI